MSLDTEHKNFEDATDFLQHYGVLGMKWGVRKDRNGRKTGTPIAGTKRASQKNTAARRAAGRTAAKVKKATTSGAKKVGTFIKKTPASVSSFLAKRKAQKAKQVRLEQAVRKKALSEDVTANVDNGKNNLQGRANTGEKVEFLGVDKVEVGGKVYVSRDAMATRSGKKLHEMSNRELSNFMERARLEQQYSEVVGRLNPSKAKPANTNQNGSKNARPKKDGVVKKFGKHVATAVVMSAATAVAKKHTQNFMDMKVADALGKKNPAYKEFIKKVPKKTTKE